MFSWLTLKKYSLHEVFRLTHTYEYTSLFTVYLHKVGIGRHKVTLIALDLVLANLLEESLVAAALLRLLTLPFRLR